MLQNDRKNTNVFRDGINAPFSKNCTVVDWIELQWAMILLAVWSKRLVFILSEVRSRESEVGSQKSEVGS